MELLIGLAVLGVIAFGVFGLGFMGWINSSGAKTREQAAQMLDGLFDGSPNVTYRTHVRALPYETVVLGADERGYTLSHETDERGVKVLIFKLTDRSKVPTAPMPVEPTASSPADRSGTIMMLLGVGIMIAGLVLVLAAPAVAALGYLAIIAGLGLAIYGEIEQRSSSGDGLSATVGGRAGLRTGVRALIIGLAVLAVVISCALFSGESASSACRDLVSHTHGGDNRFVDITFTDGDFIKGRIGEYVGGSERTAGHWECSTESGDARITFYSPAG